MAVLHPALSSPDPIRIIELSRDLPQVADLIELCFPLHLDPDGMSYVNEMRKAARDMRLIGWLANLSDLDPGRVSGFVWEEGGEIIGNLSLIPLQKDGRRVHLIANVAVHPDHRRRGIARKLTQRALTHLGHLRESGAWLQVRDDNPAAIALYQSLGFVEQAARTTWRIRPKDVKPTVISQNTAVTVRRRKPRDCANQEHWLAETYPANIRWNLPVNFRRFTPGVLQATVNFFENVALKHWGVIANGACQGVVTWQKTDSFANNLWLAFSDTMENEILSLGLEVVLKRLVKNHPLSLDYPAGQCVEIFEDLGFVKFRTLIWMWRRL